MHSLVLWCRLPPGLLRRILTPAVADIIVKDIQTAEARAPYNADTNGHSTDSTQPREKEKESEKGKGDHPLRSAVEPRVFEIDVPFSPPFLRFSSISSR